MSCVRLEELGEIWKEYDVIGIDEGQFYEDVSTINNFYLNIIVFL